MPGLGVLFELIWESSETQQKEDMIQALEEGIHTVSMSN
ncbi:MAG TPA: small acid-soluble spore protein SspI [Bacillota bacterium]|nr:small acid-soluble spore protein SspI [Bacillota bacterium]